METAIVALLTETRLTLRLILLLQGVHGRKLLSLPHSAGEDGNQEDVPKEHFLAVSAASQVETEEEVISFDQQQESNVYKGKLDQLHVSIS